MPVLSAPTVSRRDRFQSYVGLHGPSIGGGSHTPAEGVSEPVPADHEQYDRNDAESARHDEQQLCSRNETLGLALKALRPFLLADPDLSHRFVQRLN